jgi:flagellin
MAMVVRTNYSALNATRHLNKNQSTVAGSIEKLSSGFKVNRAADDASGLAISEKMKAQIKALETAVTNSEDGIGLIQTTEGYLDSIHSMLNRMVTLAEKSANGIMQSGEIGEGTEKAFGANLGVTKGGTIDGYNKNAGAYQQSMTDRDSLQAEMDQLCAEIDRVSATANFNKVKLFDGNLATKDYDKISQTPNASNSADAIADMAKIIESVVGSAENGGAGIEASAQDNAVQKLIDTIALAGNKTVSLAAGVEAGLVTQKVADELLARFAGQSIGAVAIGTGGGVGNVKVANTSNLTANDLTFGQIDFVLRNDTDFASAKAIMTDGSDLAGDLTLNGYGLTLGLPADANGGTATGLYKTYDDAKTDLKTAQNEYTVVEDALVELNKIKEELVAAIDAGTVDLGAADIANDSSTGAPAFGNALIDRLDAVLAALDANTATAEDYDNAASIDEDNTWADLLGAVGKAIGQAENDLDATTANSVAANLKTEKIDTATAKANLVEGQKNYVDAVNAFAKALPGGNFDDILGTVTVPSDGAIPTEVQDFYGKLTGDEDYINALKAKIDAALEENGYSFKTESESFFVQAGKFEGQTLHSITGYSVDQSKLTNFRTEGTAVKDETGAVTSNTLGQGLTLQIGETSNAADKLIMNVGRMNTDSLFANLTDFHNNDNNADIRLDVNSACTVKGVIGYTIDISGQQRASAAAEGLNSVINKVSVQRAELGAMQNRLDYTIDNLNTAVENVTSANSRIRDTDMAKEMTKFTMQNVLLQSAQSMLAQANAQPQNVLSLLR